MTRRGFIGLAAGATAVVAAKPGEALDWRPRDPSVLEGLRAVDAATNKELREQAAYLTERVGKRLSIRDRFSLGYEAARFRGRLEDVAIEGLRKLDRGTIRRMKTAQPFFEDMSIDAQTAPVQKSLVAIPFVDGAIIGARNSGSQGTYWNTKALFTNPTEQDAEIVLYAGNAAVPATSEHPVSFTVHAGETVGLNDVLSYFPHLTNPPAALFYKWDGIEASQGIVTSRTFTVAPDGAAGTLGQGIPGMELNQLPSSGGTSHIAPLTVDPDLYRSNVGIVNMSREESNFEVRIRGEGGALLGSKHVTLPALSFGQLNNVFREAGVPEQPGAYAEIISRNADWTDSGTNEFSAYASNVDNQSGDPTLMMAQFLAGDASPEYFLLAAAHNSGANNTFWRTDAQKINWRGENGAPSSYFFLHEGQNNCPPPQGETGAMSGNALETVRDVILNLFGHEDKKGALWSAPLNEQPTFSRTYTVDENGSFGQGLPALLKSRDNIAGENIGHIVGLEENDYFRSNVGFVNTDCAETNVHLTYKDNQGNVLLEDDLILQPHEMTQINRPFRDLGFDVENARVEVTSDNGVLAYGSIVDNATGDATTLMAKRVAQAANIEDTVDAVMAIYWPTDDVRVVLNNGEIRDIVNGTDYMSSNADTIAQIYYNAFPDDFTDVAEAKSVLLGWVDDPNGTGTGTNGELYRAEDPFQHEPNPGGTPMAEWRFETSGNGAIWQLSGADSDLLRQTVYTGVRTRMINRPGEYGISAGMDPADAPNPTWNAFNPNP